VAKNLFYAVTAYFETRQNSKVEKVYFLTWKEYEKEECVRVLDNMENLTPKQPS